MVYEATKATAALSYGMGISWLSEHGAMKLSIVMLMALALVLSPAGLREARGSSAGAQESTPTIGIDADVTGNSATSLGSIDATAVVTCGDTFQVDAFIQDVSELLAWETILSYDPTVLQVEDRDVDMFLAGNEDSRVVDASNVTPDSDGSYSLAAVDASDPPTPDSGSGTLARLTLKAVDPGVSTIGLPLIDVNDDGAPDKGSFLRDVEGNIIGDEDGDTLFDGPTVDAEITVNEPCPEPEVEPETNTATESRTEEDDDGGVSLAVIIGSIIGGVAALSLGGFAAFRLLGRRAGPS